MACWPTTMHTHVTKLKKAVMGPSRGIIGMELPFPSLYAPCYLLPKFKKPKQSAWGIMKPDHQDTLEGAAAWPQGIIYYWCLLIFPPKAMVYPQHLGFIVDWKAYEGPRAEWGNGNRKWCRRTVNRPLDIAKWHVLFQGTFRMQIKIK